MSHPYPSRPPWPARRVAAVGLAPLALVSALTPAPGQAPAPPPDKGVDRLVAAFQKHGLPLTPEQVRQGPFGERLGYYPATLEAEQSLPSRAETDPSASEWLSVHFEAARDVTNAAFEDLKSRNQDRKTEKYATWTPLGLVHRGQGFKHVTHRVGEVRYERGERGPIRGRATASAAVAVLGPDRFVYVNVAARGAAAVLRDPTPLFPAPQADPGPKVGPLEDDVFPPADPPRPKARPDPKQVPDEGFFRREDPPAPARPNPEYDALKAEAVRLAVTVEEKATRIARELADLDVSAGGTGNADGSRGGAKGSGTLRGEARPSYGAALLALRVSVKLADHDPTLDVDGNGTVDARDAAVIAQRAAAALGAK